jgi:hypothetical protein
MIERGSRDHAREKRDAHLRSAVTCGSVGAATKRATELRGGKGSLGDSNEIESICAYLTHG